MGVSFAEFKQGVVVLCNKCARFSKLGGGMSDILLIEARRNHAEKGGVRPRWGLDRGDWTSI